MAGYTHKIRLHFRSLSLTNVVFQDILSSTEQVYKSYGIKVEFASGMSLGLSPDEAKRFDHVDGSCEWKITSGELADIQRLEGSTGPFDICVFYINRFTSGLLGCGGYIPGRPSCIVASNASKWDTAHEVGHVLLGSDFSPVHSTDINNLMHATASSYASTPILTDKQVKKIKDSPMCISV